MNQLALHLALSLALQASATPRICRVDWRYAAPTPASNVVFEVYSSTNLAGPYQWRTSTDRSPAFFQETERAEFFKVRASYPDGTKSDWALAGLANN